MARFVDLPVEVLRQIFQLASSSFTKRQQADLITLCRKSSDVALEMLWNDISLSLDDPAVTGPALAASMRPGLIGSIKILHIRYDWAVAYGPEEIDVYRSWLSQCVPREVHLTLARSDTRIAGRLASLLLALNRTKVQKFTVSQIDKPKLSIQRFLADANCPNSFWPPLSLSNLIFPNVRSLEVSSNNRYNLSHLLDTCLAISGQYLASLRTLSFCLEGYLHLSTRSFHRLRQLKVVDVYRVRCLASVISETKAVEVEDLSLSFSTSNEARLLADCVEKPELSPNLRTLEAYTEIMCEPPPHGEEWHQVAHHLRRIIGACERRGIQLEAQSFIGCSVLKHIQA